MPTISVLKAQSDLAFSELQQAVEGVPESLAWARLSPFGDEYLHTDGSIFSQVLHMASGKIMYGSIGFRNTERRWREIADDFDRIEPNWDAAVTYLQEAHQYWQSSWANLTDEDLETERPRFETLWPTWKIIDVVTRHDSYHAGQIALLRYALGPTETPPTSQAEDIRTHCAGFTAW